MVLLFILINLFHYNCHFYHPGGENYEKILQPWHGLNLRIETVVILAKRYFYRLPYQKPMFSQSGELPWQSRRLSLGVVW
jgi:hypothetical protein